MAFSSLARGEEFLLWEDPSVSWDTSVDSLCIVNRQPEKYQRVAMIHFKEVSDCWAHRYPQNIEAFLQDFFNIPRLRLAKIVQGCYEDTLSLYWVFYLRVSQTTEES